MSIYWDAVHTASHPTKPMTELRGAGLVLTFEERSPWLPALLKSQGQEGSLPLSTDVPELGFTDFNSSAASARSAIVRDSHTILFPAGQIALPDANLSVTTVFQLDSALPVLRKWLELELIGSPERELRLTLVPLLDVEVESPVTFNRNGWQSQPIFTEDHFFGVEYPVGWREAQGGRVRLWHCPGWRLQPGAKYRSRTVVVGHRGSGTVRRAFGKYLEAIRLPRKAMLFNYNTWWSTPARFSEDDITQVTSQLADGFRQVGVGRIGSFTLDLGWSRPDGIWEINDRALPQGFSPLVRQAAALGGRLGLWWSPTNFYSPDSFDNDWAEANGYETFRMEWFGRDLKLACIAVGNRYQQQASTQLARLATEYDLGQFKFDGYWYECPAEDHGHLPGELSREALAEGLIEVFERLRAAAPDAWFEPTCFSDPSPWWLEWADSLIGFYGDDAPPGSVPAFVYRDSYTTARDFFNLQAEQSLIPIADQEILGIVHQTSDQLFNDAVDVVLRGNRFVSLYLNPRHMTTRDYAFLGMLMNWAKTNASLLANSRLLYPEGWPSHFPASWDWLPRLRRCYGYTHTDGSQALLFLRNPWIAPATRQFTIAELTESSSGTWTVESIYPVRSTVATGLKPESLFDIHLGPYEVRVVAITQRGMADPSPTTAPMSIPTMLDRRSGISSTGHLCTWASRLEVEIPDPGWSLCYLVEMPNEFDIETGSVEIDGEPAIAKVIRSSEGWAAFTPPAMRANAWNWYVVDLPQGRITADASFVFPAGAPTVSAWLLKAAAPAPSTANAHSDFPQHPEPILLTSVAAIPLDGPLGLAPTRDN